MPHVTKILILIISFPLYMPFTNAQNNHLKPLSALINKDDPGWSLVQQWIKEAKNKVEVLPKDSLRADSALYKTQVTTRSPMGAIIHETGGILIDNGWIRILGSGCKRLDRSLMDWNKGKSFTNFGDPSSFLLIADDVMGGFYAINAGALSKNEIGKVFYYSPDNLQWESLGYGYSDFLIFCFSGNLKGYYENMRWTNWEKDIRGLDGNKGISCFPFLFTKEGKDINKVSRKPVPIEELWSLYNDLPKQLNKEK